MEENGLISRNSNENNQNIEYILTDKGKKLNKVIYELAMFTLTTDLGNEFYDDETKIELENIFKNTLINNCKIRNSAENMRKQDKHLRFREK